MKLSKLLSRLQEIHDEHGDVNCSIMREISRVEIIKYGKQFAEYPKMTGVQFNDTLRGVALSKRTGVILIGNEVDE